MADASSVSQQLSKAWSGHSDDRCVGFHACAAWDALSDALLSAALLSFATTVMPPIICGSGQMCSHIQQSSWPTPASCCSDDDVILPEPATDPSDASGEQQDGEEVCSTAAGMFITSHTC